MFIEHPVEPESNATDGIELFEDSQLTSRSKAIATKTKEIEQVRIQSAKVQKLLFILYIIVTVNIY